MTELLRGIDISYAQDHKRLNWVALSELCQFVICRATFGVDHDKQVEHHVREARRVGLMVGLYAFHRPHIDPLAQLDAFTEVADAVGYGPGDLCPALDVEKDPGAPVELRKPQPSWNDSAAAHCDMLAERFGECIVYLSQRDWHRLGEPEWPLKRPNWVAHWTNAPEPLTPGDRPWTIWQRAVSKIAGVYPHDLDQNVARLPLPVIINADAERARIEGVTAATIDNLVRNRPR